MTFFLSANLGIKAFYPDGVWQRRPATRGTIQSLLDIYHLLAERDNQTFQICVDSKTMVVHGKLPTDINTQTLNYFLQAETKRTNSAIYIAGYRS